MATETVPVIKVACTISDGNPHGFYLAELLPDGAKLYEECETVIRLQPESQFVIEEPIVEHEPASKTIIDVDIPDTQSNEYFNAMTDIELKEYLDSKKVKYHHLAGHKKLVKSAYSYVNFNIGVN